MCPAFRLLPSAAPAPRTRLLGKWSAPLIGLLAKLIMHVGKAYFTLRVFLIEIRVGNEVFVKHAFLIGAIHESKECFPFFRLGLHRYQLAALFLPAVRQSECRKQLRYSHKARVAKRRESEGIVLPVAVRILGRESFGYFIKVSMVNCSAVGTGIPSLVSQSALT